MQIKFLKHMTEQPFIFATGAAALVHSTWALGVLFAGKPPIVDNWISGLAFAWWLAPALMIAFALDVGQIVTSAEIRQGQRSKTKYATFFIFAAATYYLQWLYIAHHMPLLDLADGVRTEWSWIVTLLRDSSMWIIPALLPLSTTLYTLSGHGHEEMPMAKPLQNTVQIEPVRDSHELLPEPEETNTGAASDVYPNWLDEIVSSELTVDDSVQIDEYKAHCEDCNWTGSYGSELSARRALSAHKAHCTARVPVEQNGHVS